MRLRLLLAMLFVSGGLLLAQDTVRTLVITEVKMERADMSYVELTNMGDVDLNLSDFEFGRISPWNTLPEPGWPEAPQNDDQTIERLPDVILPPGESYVIAGVGDYTEEAYARDMAEFGFSYDWGQQFLTKPEWWEIADLQVHFSESPSGDPTDSISRSDVPALNYPTVMETWGGRDVWYIRHHISPTDSAVVDQVGGLFTDEDGTNPDGGMVDVAGVEGATGNSIMMRRFDVKKGNTTFVTGIDYADSEWIPIPMLNGGYGDKNRAAFWTMGNHVDAVLDETTLVSSTVDVDWAQKIISVPWGIRNDDSIMFQFDYTPGLAWGYEYAPVHEDSAYSSARTGDVMTIYACGNQVSFETFTIQVLDPTADANIVVPMYELTDDDDYDGAGIPWEVTDGVPGMDTISQIPFACRVDTLLKYLEKAPNATWEFVWADGNERTDLMDGDLLRVTAEDGTSVKDYYLKLDNYIESRNADLSSITWPDIPEEYKGLYGWIGDTIPNFASAITEYLVQIPYIAEGIPALVAKADDDNASVEVKRAVNLFGSDEDKTATFTVTAENDTTILEYSIVLEKEKNPAEIQPWDGEPFFSQIVWQDQWANAFMEIINPRPTAIDLSEYMIFFGDIDNWSDAILSSSGTDDYVQRYRKYIPGRIWPDTAVWQADPGKCIQDLNVNTIVYPGDVFVLTDIISTSQAYSGGGFGGEGLWPAEENGDVHFSKNCPWDSPPENWNALQQWNTHYFLFKIVGEGGDSVRNGWKAANDPDDFVLLDVWGAEGTGATHVIGGEEMQQTSGYVRKPHIYEGNTVLGESFGTDMDNSEWVRTNRPYFQSLGVGWPMDILRITDGIGSHFMDPITFYKSSVSSAVYLVSRGYSMDELIKGVVTATTADAFIANLIPADTGQTLILKSGGVEISGDAAVTHGDSLVVISADSANTTRYFLNVTDDGLSDDAVLTSAVFTIDTDPAMVSGFEIGTLLKDVVEGVTLPVGASLNVINENDASVPLKTINFDTMYVDVMATDQVYFEVVAEDAVTKIVYQLMPDHEASDAYVTSSVFEVDQDALLISLIPPGTRVGAFFSNLVPATGASIVLYDKLGYERADGVVVLDDKLVVTAEDGVTTKTYFLTILDELPNYLAYLISDTYLVDQDALTITGVLGTESVTDFSANVTPAVSATFEVQDASGAAKIGSDMMLDDDMVQVTAGNGVNVSTYVITLDHTGISDLSSDEISIYPNPSNGQVNVAGAELGSRIRVYNSIGLNIYDQVVLSGIETISLDDQPAGMYFITISNADEVTGQYKLIRQ